ncbi:MAG: 50S ribosomal protein L10 [Thermoleophilaceae bacterium]|jgi:large subunit ribosomal protein L10
MNKEQKAAAIEEVAGAIQEAGAIFAVDYRGISVPQAKELRTALTDAGARFRVVKNTLTERAADQAGAESLKELLEGPTAFTFVAEDGDVALAAKALSQFRRQNQVLEFKGGTMGGEVLTVDEIESIARLPGRDQLHGQLVGVIASPITTLVRGLASMISGLAIQLQQIQEQGLVGGEAPDESTVDRPPSTEEEPEPSEAPGDPVAEAEAAEPDESTVDGGRSTVDGTSDDTQEDQE